MSAVKKLVLVLALAVVTVSLYSAAASAQASPGNPSGGTGLRQTRVEGTGPVLPTDFLSRWISLDAGLSGWVGTLIANRYPFAVTSRPVTGRTLLAVTPRKIWGR